MSLGRIYSILRKEFIQIRRDPRTLAMILAMPMMQLILFGYAVSTNVTHSATAVWDQDRTAESRRLLDRMEQSTSFRITRRAESDREIAELLDGGHVKAAIIIPPGYAANLRAGRTAQAQVLIDGSDPLVSQTLFSTSTAIGQAESVEIITRMTGRPPQQLVEVRPRVWYNPDMKSVNYNVPGLVGTILQNVTLMLTAFAVVRERERGTLEQLIVTPIRPLELMIGKIVPYLVIGFVDMTLILGVGTLWFDVPIVGNIGLLLFSSLLFLMGALGLGLLLSTISKTQMQAMQLSFFFMLPNILLSGYMYPREAMPKVIYALSSFIPLTYFLQVLRGVILKGAGVQHLAPQLAILAAFGLGTLTLSALRFRKTLE